MKKLFSSLMAVAMLLSLTACGDKDETSGTVEMATTVTTEQSAEEETTEAVTENVTEATTEANVAKRTAARMSCEIINAE